ncbi:MAG TPA: hypothetical protein VH089_21275 [Streptosporangiaceae bacterium]|nr:hypothetical protein [Streptosporangiaceae bacterium]
MTTLTRDHGAPPTPARQRLTAIEELDYLLDRAWEPNLVLWELHAHGHLDRDLLAEALTAVLGSDSGARRRLAATGRWGRRLYWRQAPAPGPYAPAADADGSRLLTVASWRTPDELEALRQRLFAWPIALDQAVVRVVLAVGPSDDALILQVHHTAFDGISSLRLLSAITQAYRDRAHQARHLHPVPSVPAPRPAPATTPDPQPKAPAPPTTPATPTTSAPPTTSTPPAPPAPPIPKASVDPKPRRWPGPVTRIAPQAGQPDRPGYGFVLIEDVVARPGTGDFGPRPTVNDLLVAALCLAIDRWNTAHGQASGQISVTIPINGRTASQRWQGDGNLSWLMRVITTPARRASPPRLLASVAAQTRAARDRGRTGGTDAVSRLLATAWAPVPVKRRAARLIRGLAAPVLTDTSLVSNLGVLPEPPTFDGSGTEALWLAPPCPMPRGLAVGAVSVAGRLYLSVRYRLALMDQAAAEDFTACFRAAIAELARPGPVVVTGAP